MPRPDPPACEPVAVRRPRPLVLALSAVGVVVVLLVAAQLILPSLAERSVADDLERFGPRPDVEVSAFPAVKLLFGKADRVEIDMRLARMPGSAPLAEQLERTADADELDARVRELRVGPLRVRDARLTKDGETLRASANVRESELQAALPSFLEFRGAEQQPGDGLLLDGSVTFLGATINAQARVRATEGAITAAPENIPFGALATFTVFQDPRVNVTSVGATTRPGGFGLTATGRLTG